MDNNLETQICGPPMQDAKSLFCKYHPKPIELISDKLTSYCFGNGENIHSLLIFLGSFPNAIQAGGVVNELWGNHNNLKELLRDNEGKVIKAKLTHSDSGYKIRNLYIQDRDFFFE